MELKDGKQAVYAKNRAQWRNWLKKNGQTEKSVWLILYHKKSKMQSINLVEATEEALCFGWIDSLCKKREGLMTEQGQLVIDSAKQAGRWEVSS